MQTIMKRRRPVSEATGQRQLNQQSREDDRSSLLAMAASLRCFPSSFADVDDDAQEEEQVVFKGSTLSANRWDIWDPIYLYSIHQVLYEHARAPKFTPFQLCKAESSGALCCHRSGLSDSQSVTAQHYGNVVC